MRTALGLLGAILFVSAFPSTALAYDCGYHWDLTRDALAQAGFGPDAVAVVEVENFYADGFSSATQVIDNRWVRALSLDDDWGALFGPAEMRLLSDESFHFSGLENSAEVEDRWDQLVRGTYHAAKTAEREGDARGLLSVLGTSLHAVQDFYAHSNWAALESRGLGPALVPDPTWFDLPRAARARADVYTSRPGADPAKDHPGEDDVFVRCYRQAFYASRQWAELVRSWLDEDFWGRAARLSAPEIWRERELVRSLALYSGHWKGPSSERIAGLAVVGGLYTRRADRAAIGRWARYARLAATGSAEAPDAVPVPVVPDSLPPVPRQTWVAVRVEEVKETDRDKVFDVDPFGRADFYAEVTVNGRVYTEAVHFGSDHVTPEAWLTLAPLLPGTSQVSLSVAIRDQDTVLGSAWPRGGGGDDLCDINPEPGYRTWTAELSLADLAAAGSPAGGLGVSTDGWRAAPGDGAEAAAKFVIELLESGRDLGPRPGVKDQEVSARDR